MTGNVPDSEPTVVTANGIQIAYDTFGHVDGAPLLLIAGIGLSMMAWDERFCSQLAREGYRVIRFDNRDMGRSTWFDSAGVPDVKAMMRGQRVDVPYLLRDMAEDTVGLIDSMGFEAAHILGISMGAMIAQTIAIHHPECVRTMTLIMSTTGDPALQQARPEASAVMLEPPPREWSAFIQQSLRTWHVLNGTGVPLDEEYIRQAARQLFDYGLNPAGSVRQLAAILASGNRREALESVNVPALVIHGDADPLLPVEHGIATADALSSAQLIRIEEMGHLLAPIFWSRVIDAVSQHAR